MTVYAIDMMTTPVYKVKNTDTVGAVIERFVEHRISGLPVVNDRNEIVGYLSDGDIMRYIGKHHDKVIDFGFYTMIIQGDYDELSERAERLKQLNVMAVARKKVTTVQWDTPLDVVAALLGQKKIKKVPVERRGVVIGIISRGDVIRYVYQNYLQ